jgi:hypothetical protein
MKQFKIRASACGLIMTNDRSGKGMGKTAQSYCEQWLKEQLYGRRKEVTTKYMDKGLICEDNSLDFIAAQLELGMLIKNEQYFEDDHMTGTPDIVLKDLVIDAKNSWDCFTFPLFEADIPDAGYFWQAQCYMHLTGVHCFKLCYVLSDTPANLIEKEAFFYARNNGYGEVDEQLLADFTAKMTYPGIPDNLKLKVYDIPYDADAVKRIQERVEQCREYISNLKY